MVAARTRSTSRRKDVVFIRKSTTTQDERAQIANVESMLTELGVTIPDEYWFVCTVPRAKVKGNEEFKRLLALVEADKVGRVFIESQDRWGTADVAELFTLLGLLADHDTQLFDLREKTDLTSKDDTTQIKAFLGGLKSKKERKDLAYRSMRTKVNNFKSCGSWPTGTHPFGFGKACYSSDGRLLWEWQPISRTKGQIFYADKNGKLKPGAEDVSLPRKEKSNIIKLVPSKNKAFTKSVRLTFELFSKVGLTRRKITTRLNEEGRTFYGKPFTHSLVGEILKNPAYVGDTHFGKMKSGEHYSFDKQGGIVELGKQHDKHKRDEAERIIIQNTHKGLISRELWNQTQSKLEDEEERPTYTPRNPNYFLKSVLVCGHCGKNMTGRTENTGTDKEQVVYMCSSYISGRSIGQESKCGAYRITHADAEKLLLEHNLDLDVECEIIAFKEHWRIKREQKNAVIQKASKEQETDAVVREGVAALIDFYEEHYDANGKQLSNFKKAAEAVMAISKGADCTQKMRSLVKKVEAAFVAKAQAELQRLQSRLQKITNRWVDATEMMQAVLQDQCKQLEVEIKNWEKRVQPISKRIKDSAEQVRDLTEQQTNLKNEWPKMVNLQKGEAMRRFYKSVALFWDKEFHESEKNPGRPRKTERTGRNRYLLRQDKIKWQLQDATLEGSS